eukprot:2325418-Rhodomonas_salina.3
MHCPQRQYTPPLETVYTSQKQCTPRRNRIHRPDRPEKQCTPRPQRVRQQERPAQQPAARYWDGGAERRGGDLAEDEGAELRVGEPWRRRAQHLPPLHAPLTHQSHPRDAAQT